MAKRLTKKRAAELEQLDKQDKEQRDKQREQTRADLVTALTNKAGLDRLEAISDDDWDKATTEDDAEQAGQPGG